MKRVLRKSRESRGAVLIEMAIMLPFMTLLFLGVVDMGLVIWEHQIVQNAARAGARFSALPRNWINPSNPGVTVDDIRQRVVDYLLEEGISVNMGDISVTQNYPINVGALTLSGSEVSVTYTRPLLLSGGGLIPFAQVTLHGRSVFRNLY
ncbi:MAG TPA: TadE family protein [Vicinamibacteria bacterium]|nr:TadE family protein [Vicinamibacteria bacterium]